VALDWIMTQAERAGLRFIASERAYYSEHSNVDDKLYDPRSGLGALYRWLPRDIEVLCLGSCAPKIHMSVLERAAHGTEDYAPGNLPRHPQVVFTETGSDADDDVAKERAEKLQQAIATDHVLLHEVSNTVWFGRQAYVLFMTTCLVVAPLALRFLGLFWAFSALVLSALIALPTAYLSKGRRQRHFSTFWLKMQQHLREVLKSTRRPSVVGGPGTSPWSPDAALEPLGASLQNSPSNDASDAGPDKRTKQG
jgi:hypothetical protein